MSEISRFFEHKIAALLHDPVNKAWIMIESGDHEEIALKYAIGMLENTGLAENIRSILNNVRSLRRRHIVGYADALASSIDRWIITILTTYRDTQGEFKYIKGAFRIQYADKLKNIIDPRFYVLLEKPSNDSIAEFIKTVNNLLVKVRGNTRLIYHLLYTLYEPVFYSKAGSSREGFVSSVADTRAPTHTVFDHAYATSSMINIVYSRHGEITGRNPVENLDGYIVVIDLAGVQKFISASRKLRDLWVSSWLASALTWATIWPLIYALGPDIMVSPSPRNNPFYYSTLLAVLRSKIDDTREIEKYFVKAVGDVNKDIPRFGVMPTQTILLLPKTSIILQALNEVVKEDTLPQSVKVVVNEYIKNAREDATIIAELIINIYKSLWNTIIEETKNIILNPSKKVLENNESKEVLKGLRKILLEYNCWSIDDLEKVFDLVKNNPPLPIRVVVLNIRNVLKKELEKRKLERNSGELEEYEVYDVLIRYAYDELKKSSTLKFSYPPVPRIEELYSYITKTSSKGCLSRRGYEYCSVCGLMPAILRMPSVEEWDNVWKKKLENEKIKPYIIEPLISPGERLCIYDLIKRILTIDEIFNDIVKKIMHRNTKNIDLRSFPSTSHIASIQFYDKLLEIYLWFHDNKELFKEFDIRLWDLIRELLGETPPRKSTVFYKHMENLKDKLEKKLGKEEERSIDVVIDYIDPEIHILTPEGRRALSKMIHQFVRKPRTDIPLNTYYSIIRADADNMGKLLKGQINIVLGLEPEDYIINALEGSAKEVVRFLVNNSENEAFKLLALEYRSKNIHIDPDEITKYNIGRLKNLMKKIKERRGIPLTPTYHATISRSLMINTLVDQYIVEGEDGKGFIVYSGGDDLLALAPVSTSITIAVKTRRTFSLGHYNETWRLKGFMSKELLEKTGLTDYVVPLIVTGGRSYSIVYLHYRHPLYIGLKSSYELLKEKDIIEWIIDGTKIRKDILNIAYLPRGQGMINTVLPFKQKRHDTNNNYNIGELIEVMNNSWKEIESGIIARSLIYDLQREKTMLKKLLNQSSSKDIFRRFIKYYIVSRNISGDTKDIKIEDLNITKLLERYINYKIKYGNSREESIVFNIIDFFKIFDSAVRGVE